jgi:hypothetical protein
MGVRVGSCGKLVKKPGMPEARPCLRNKGHSSAHTPDLTGLKNVFGYIEILRRAPERAQNRAIRWRVLDKFGGERTVRADYFFINTSRRGRRRPIRRSGLGGKDKNGKTYPEYHAVLNHYAHIFNKNDPAHSSYKDMIFYDKWNSKEGGSLVDGARWIRKNLGPKPGPGWQLHVLKTKKHPHGFFGPGGIVWRHKMDRHDQDLLDLIHEWPKKKLREFVQNEIQPLLKVA